MDPITARAALRLAPTVALTVEQIDAAHQAAVQAHHPARYADRTARASAVAWVHSLDAARATLLAEAAAMPASPTPRAPGTASAPNRHRAAWIAGIAGACVLLIGLVVGIGFGVAALGERFAQAEDAAAAEEDPGSYTYTAEEAGYHFPATLVVFVDGRYDAECPSEHELGCWQMGLLPEESCTRGWLSLSFADENGETVYTEERELEFTAGERELLVFGGDEYFDAWIDDVVCLDLRPATNGQARDVSGSTSPSV